MDEKETDPGDRSPARPFSKCRNQCKSACDDEGCCSSAYTGRPSTCTAQYRRPCVCLQRLRLDYNVVEPWRENWQEEFSKLRKMWSNHSKLSAYDLSGTNSSNGARVSKYCDTNCCWHERPYRTNSVGVKCACCSTKSTRNCDTFDGISYERIPRLCERDYSNPYPEPSDSRCQCFNWRNYRNSNRPENRAICECCAEELQGIPCDQGKPIVACYSDQEFRGAYGNDGEQEAVYCPCCVFARRPSGMPSVNDTFRGSEPMIPVQRCYRKRANERPATANYAGCEERKSQRCYWKTAATRRSTCPLERDSYEDVDSDEAEPYSGRQVRVYPLKKSQPRKNITAHDLRDTEERPRHNERPATRHESRNKLAPRSPSVAPDASKRRLVSPRKVPHNLQSTSSCRQQEQHIPERLVSAFNNTPPSTHARKLSSDAEPRQVGESERKVHITIGGNDQRKRSANNDKCNDFVTIYDDTHPNYMEAKTSDFNYEFAKYFPEKDNNSKTHRQRMPRRHLIREFDEAKNDADGDLKKLK